jgi:hypothetical protein
MIFQLKHYIFLTSKHFLIFSKVVQLASPTCPKYGWSGISYLGKGGW